MKKHSQKELVTMVSRYHGNQVKKVRKIKLHVQRICSFKAIRFIFALAQAYGLVIIYIDH